MKRVFNHTMHKKLWDYIAENPTEISVERASAAIGWRGDILPCDCFACDPELGLMIDEGRSRCECPLDWPPNEYNCPCSGPNSPYIAWENADTKELTRQFAEHVRDMPLSKHAAKYKII